MPQPNEYTVTELKEKAKALKMATTGTKAELIARIMEADPSGAWMENDEENRRREDNIHQRQSEIYRREKELVERELELARREIAMLRASGGVSVASQERAGSHGTATWACANKLDGDRGLTIS